MKYHFLLFLLLFVGISLTVQRELVPAAHAQDLPVFPSASGFGSTTPAGSGRHLAVPHTTIIKVTSLSDSGPGTLRNCVDFDGPRTCVFEIAGRIQLETELLLKFPYITIAGQTAPFPGVLISGAGIRVATNDVLIQHLQIRVGDAASGPEPEVRDGLTVAGKNHSIAQNVMLDHLSISWAVDENFDVWYDGTSDVTLSHSIVSESLYDSIHPKGPHGMGVLIGDETQRVSLHHNLLAHNYDRNPRVKPGARAEFISNLVYDWGGSSSWNQANLSDADKVKLPTQFVFVGNYYKRGPKSPKGATLYAAPIPPKSAIYVQSNFGPNRLEDSIAEWKIASIKEKPYHVQNPPFPLSGIVPLSADETLPYVMDHSGARPKERNVVDARILSEIIEGTGSIIDCVSGCSREAGGFPIMPTRTRALSLPKNPDSDSDGDGYTNLEEMLQTMAVALE